MRITITNQSTLCSDADVSTIAAAVSAQMVDVAGAWGLVVPTVNFVPKAAYLEATYDVGVVVLDDSDQAGQNGYHAVDPNGRPYARVFARDAIAGPRHVDPASLAGPQASQLVLACVGQVVSHEGIEALCDEFASYWSDMRNGSEMAKEACDPVESSTYTVRANGETVTVSDYVLPAFFNAGATVGPFDRLGQVTAALRPATGGYVILRAEGQTAPVFGSEMPDWRRQLHEQAEADAKAGVDSAHLASRTAKRFAGAQGSAI